MANQQTQEPHRLDEAGPGDADASTTARQAQQSQLSHTLATSHGCMHVVDVPARPGFPADQALVLVHGNSSSSHIFKHILAAPSISRRRIVVDLLGHGASENARDPGTSYTQRGYAEAVIEVLRQLQVRSFVVLGWSLGGHIGIEMLALLGHADGLGGARRDAGLECKGLVITGTPPANGPDQVKEGFDPSDGAAETTAKDDEDDEHMNYAATEEWPDDVYTTFPAEGAGRPYEPWMEAMARRTDGRARSVMWNSFAGGHGVDQRRVLETSPVPCAVINGANEPFVNLKAVKRVKYRSLWEGQCYELSDGHQGLGHTPFWENPGLYQPYLDRFVSYCFET